MIIPYGRPKYVIENYECWKHLGKKEQLLRFGFLEYFMKAPYHKLVAGAVMMQTEKIRSSLFLCVK